MKIREAIIEDLEQIAIIQKQIQDLHFKERPKIFKEKNINMIEEELVQIMRSKEEIIIVAVDEKSIIYGILIYKIKEIKNHINLRDSKILWVDDIGVNEKYRKKGIGKKLMKEAENIARLQKCNRLELNCWSFNEDALNFYKSIELTTQRNIMEKEIGGSLI